MTIPVRAEAPGPSTTRDGIRRVVAGDRRRPGEWTRSEGRGGSSCSGSPARLLRRRARGLPRRRVGRCSFSRRSGGGGGGGARAGPGAGPEAGRRTTRARAGGARGARAGPRVRRGDPGRGPRRHRVGRPGPSARRGVHGRRHHRRARIRRNHRLHLHQLPVGHHVHHLVPRRGWRGRPRGRGRTGKGPAVETPAVRSHSGRERERE